MLDSGVDTVLDTMPTYHNLTQLNPTYLAQLNATYLTQPGCHVECVDTVPDTIISEGKTRNTTYESCQQQGFGVRQGNNTMLLYK